MQSVDLARTVWAYLLARLNIDTENEDGMTTTEIAVVTFLLVGAAIVVMGIIYNAAKNNANNIPEPAAPGAPGAP
jgi:hypothetical protein